MPSPSGDYPRAPVGYMAAAASPAISGGTINGQVFRDIHGERRFNPTGRGADEWDDYDGDGIPNFADSNPLSAGNAFQDLDADQINELLEYLGGTDPNNAEPANHTLAQIFYNKTEVDNLFYTRAQSDALYLTRPELDLEYWRKDEVLRVLPQGGLGMGEFTNGTLP